MRRWLIVYTQCVILCVLSQLLMPNDFMPSWIQVFPFKSSHILKYAYVYWLPMFVMLHSRQFIVSCIIYSVFYGSCPEYLTSVRCCQLIVFGRRRNATSMDKVQWVLLLTHWPCSFETLPGYIHAVSNPTHFRSSL